MEQAVAIIRQPVTSRPDEQRRKVSLHAAHNEEAAEVFREALQLAEKRGQGSVVILADKYLAAVTEAHNPDTAGKPQGLTAGQRDPEQLAEHMAALLRTTESFANE